VRRVAIASGRLSIAAITGGKRCVRKAFRLGLLLLCCWTIRADANQGEPAEAEKPTEASVAAPAVPQPTDRPPQLPWEATRSRAAEPVLRPPTSPREILERYEIGASQLEGFFSGEPLGPGEEDVLAKILFRIPRLGREFFEAWRIKDVTWDQLAASPGEYRAQLFALRGKATQVTEHRILPELAELVEFESYYRVRIELTDSPFQAIVCTRQIPASWQIGVPLSEPAATDGLFLKIGGSAKVDGKEGGDADPKPDLVFAAGRVAWFPDREQPANGIGPDQLALAAAGFDLGLFDDLRKANGRGLGDADREAFYQLLSAAPRLSSSTAPRRSPSDTVAASDRVLDIVPLLERPQEHQLRQFPVQGIARRITRIAVGDVDIQRRFGIDHYYEIDLFLPLGEKTLRFGKDPTGEENPVYTNSFPATLIVRELPSNLQPGDKLYEQVGAEAVFFKLWTYRSGYTQKFGGLQPAPLFVAQSVETVKVTSTASVASGVLVGAAFAVALAVIGVIFWWFRGSDREHARRTREFRSGDGSQPDFSQLQ
jgi:hypothetical protein